MTERKTTHQLNLIDLTTEKIRKLNLSKTSSADIHDLLQPLFDGYLIDVPVLNPGLSIFSSKCGSKPKLLKEIIYADPALAKAGRANIAGNAILYCQTSREGAIFASSPKKGNTITVTEWKTKKQLVLNQIGYTKSIFKDLNSIREVASWNKSPVKIHERTRPIYEFLSEVFVKSIPKELEESYYKLTAAIAEQLLVGDSMDGLIYPSVEMRANGDTIAIKPSYVDNHLIFVKSELLRVDQVIDFGFEVSVLDRAKELNRRKQIEWFIASPSSNSKRYGTIGWQEFLQQKQSILKEYELSKETTRNRPVQVEHGNTGEASIRKWLSESLPQKYGVTSGFIIPDIRKMNYRLNHYDVIIYDALNSPVLWGSNNPDKSEIGRERAIPAKYVKAVFEIKASFNKKSISEAIDKLSELKEFEDQLSEHFSSGIIFFELKKAIQKKTVVAEQLYKNDIPGYFGGLILKAENIDPNITGYFEFNTTVENSKTESKLPLVKKVSSLQRNEDGNPFFNGQGVCVTAHAIDDIWNFDKGFCPIVKNLHLMWSYNSFPIFYMDLLERLKGEYIPGQPMKDAYGLSFSR